VEQQAEMWPSPGALREQLAILSGLNGKHLSRSNQPQHPHANMKSRALTVQFLNQYSAVRGSGLLPNLSRGRGE
jgi:hypothetical protein